jgi:hypothetical protein
MLDALHTRERQRARRPLVVLGLLGPLALLLALGAAGVWARQQAVTGATQQIVEHTLESATGYATLVSTVVDRNLSAARRQVEREAESPALARALAATLNGDEAAAAQLQAKTDELFEAYSGRSFHNWVVADANAVVRARTPIDPSVIGKRYAFREWFTGEPDVPSDRAPDVAAPRKTATITRAFVSTAAGRAVVVSVASPVWAGQGALRRVVGVISGTIQLDTFNEWLVEAEGERRATGCPDRFAVLFNHSQLVRHPCPQDAATPLPIEPPGYASRDAVQRLWTSPEARTADFADPLRSDRSYLAATRSLRENPDWRVVVEFDREQSLAPVTRLTQQFGTIGLIAAAVGLLAVIGMWVMLFRLTREGTASPSRPTHAAAR